MGKYRRLVIKPVYFEIEGEGFRPENSDITIWEKIIETITDLNMLEPRTKRLRIYVLPPFLRSLSSFRKNLIRKRLD